MATPAEEAGILAVVGLKVVNVVAGACGAFVSLRFFDKLDAWQKWTTFFGGWVMAAYGGAPLTEYLQLAPKLEVGMVLVLGLFGMSFAAAVIKALQEVPWSTIIGDGARAIIRKIFGGSSGGGDKT